jgi:hypothetical protein
MCEDNTKLHYNILYFKVVFNENNNKGFFYNQYTYHCTLIIPIHYEYPT